MVRCLLLCLTLVFISPAALAGIYADLWAIDQAENGLVALRSQQAGDAEQGYVVVNEAVRPKPGHLLLPRYHIPEHKKTSYRLVGRLFDNYQLDPARPEHEDEQERAELIDLLQHVLNSKVMRAAKAYIEQRQGQAISDKDWARYITTLWFRPYSKPAEPDLTGFEHIVIGESQHGRLEGYHFWFKYLYDKGLSDMRYLGTRYGPERRLAGINAPAVVTGRFRWRPSDQGQSLIKEIGGFWVGCSIEGLMAIATVRFTKSARPPGTATIGRHRYRLKVFASPDGKSLRTFYPVFLGAAR